MLKNNQMVNATYVDHHYESFIRKRKRFLVLSYFVLMCRVFTFHYKKSQEVHRVLEYIDIHRV